MTDKVVETKTETVEKPKTPAELRKLSEENKKKADDAVRRREVDRLIALGETPTDAEKIVADKIEAAPTTALDILFPDTRTAFERKEDVEGVGQYTGSPVVALALEYTGDNKFAINDFGGEFAFLEPNGDVFIETREGRIKLAKGDFVVITRGEALIKKEDVYVVKPYLFKENYKVVAVDPTVPGKPPVPLTHVPPVVKPPVPVGGPPTPIVPATPTPAPFVPPKP